jgi:hypothetical protein
MYDGKGFKMLAVLNQHCRVEFGHSCTSNSVVAFYPSWNHAVIKAVLSISVCPAPPVIKPSLSVPVSSVSSLRCIVLLKNLSAVIKQMSGVSILPGLNHCFTVADLGATDHMFPDKSAFISYKLVSNLQVKMKNNSFLPVLGHGLAVISFNGQRILVWNALHVPGLVIPLYNLWDHFTHQQPLGPFHPVQLWVSWGLRHWDPSVLSDLCPIMRYIKRLSSCLKVLGLLCASRLPPLRPTTMLSISLPFRTLFHIGG